MFKDHACVYFMSAANTMYGYWGGASNVAQNYLQGHEYILAEVVPGMVMKISFVGNTRFLVHIFQLR